MVHLPNISVAMNSSSVSHGKWERGDALFMPEEVVRINFGLHQSQSPEVILEVFGAPNTCFLKACVSLLVHAQIKVPIIDICSPWLNIRFHVLINVPNPI